MDQIIDDAIALNWRSSDKDDLLHILSHIDVTNRSDAINLEACVSPTASIIYTSIFNAYFLKSQFPHLNIHGIPLNMMFPVRTRGKDYEITFINSMYSTGSVAVLIRGDFGTALYTGYFCYYPGFFHLKPIMSFLNCKKPLTTLYLDGTYFERPCSFDGLETVLQKVVRLIRKHSNNKVYIYAEKLSMDYIVYELALRLREKLYVNQDRLERIKLIGGDKYFTTNSYESRIFIDKGYVQKKGPQCDIIIMLVRHPKFCEEFEVNGPNKSSFYYHFYPHSSNIECCKLISDLQPENLVRIEPPIIDSSKVQFTSPLLVATKSFTCEEKSTDQLNLTQERKSLTQDLSKGLLNDPIPNISSNFKSSSKKCFATQDMESSSQENDSRVDAPSPGKIFTEPVASPLKDKEQGDPLGATSQARVLSTPVINTIISVKRPMALELEASSKELLASQDISPTCKTNKPWDDHLRKFSLKRPATRVVKKSSKKRSAGKDISRLSKVHGPEDVHLRKSGLIDPSRDRDTPITDIKVSRKRPADLIVERTSKKQFPNQDVSPTFTRDNKPIDDVIPKDSSLASPLKPPSVSLKSFFERFSDSQPNPVENVLEEVSPQLRKDSSILCPNLSSRPLQVIPGIWNSAPTLFNSAAVTQVEEDSLAKTREPEYATTDPTSPRMPGIPVIESVFSIADFSTNELKEMDSVNFEISSEPPQVPAPVTITPSLDVTSLKKHRTSDCLPPNEVISNKSSYSFKEHHEPQAFRNSGFSSNFKIGLVRLAPKPSKPAGLFSNSRTRIVLKNSGKLISLGKSNIVTQKSENIEVIKTGNVLMSDNNGISSGIQKKYDIIKKLVSPRLCQVNSTLNCKINNKTNPLWTNRPRYEDLIKSGKEDTSIAEDPKGEVVYGTIVMSPPQNVLKVNKDSPSLVKLLHKPNDFEKVPSASQRVLQPIVSSPDTSYTLSIPEDNEEFINKTLERIEHMPCEDADPMPIETITIDDASDDEEDDSRSNKALCSEKNLNINDNLNAGVASTSNASDTIINHDTKKTSDPKENDCNNKMSVQRLQDFCRKFKIIDCAVRLQKEEIDKYYVFSDSHGAYLQRYYGFTKFVSQKRQDSKFEMSLEFCRKLQTERERRKRTSTISKNSRRNKRKAKRKY